MRVLSSLLLVLLLLAGCGGGGGSSSASSEGIAKVLIVWPARARGFVPASANSVVVVLSLDGVRKGSETLARPGDGSPSTATFDGLANSAFGNPYRADITAYPNADGTGTAQATGSVSIAVAGSTSDPVEVSLASSVTNLSILPATLDKNGVATVSVSATNSNGDAVLLATDGTSETITWRADKISNSLGAMVDAVTFSSTAGPRVTLTGAHSGTTQIHAFVNLGGTTPLEATGTVTVGAIQDGTGTVTVS